MTNRVRPWGVPPYQHKRKNQMKSKGQEEKAGKAEINIYQPNYYVLVLVDTYWCWQITERKRAKTFIVGYSVYEIATRRAFSKVKNIPHKYVKLHINVLQFNRRGLIYGRITYTLTSQHSSVQTCNIRDLTILGRQRDGDGQNKLLQINGIVKIVRRILSIV